MLFEIHIYENYNYNMCGHQCLSFFSHGVHAIPRCNRGEYRLAISILHTGILAVLQIEALFHGVFVTLFCSHVFSLSAGSRQRCMEIIYFSNYKREARPCAIMVGYSNSHCVQHFTTSHCRHLSWSQACPLTGQELLFL